MGWWEGEVGHFCVLRYVNNSNNDNNSSDTLYV